jgi:large subunit ribosomal protein L10
MTHKAKAAEYKKKVVTDFVKLMSDYPIIAVLDMESLPTPQLQNMRSSLRDKVVIRMTKRRLLDLALVKAKEKIKGIELLSKNFRGMPALLFTKENPFSLYKTLEKSKSSAPAKAGQTAPKDIIVPAGATPFAPGPIIGELGSLGIKAGVDAGKVMIKEDKLLVEEGQIINDKAASLLTRLGIMPMEIGLNIVAVFENGTIYPKSLLAIDEKQFEQNLVNCHNWAYNLAFEIGYTCKDNIEHFISKAFNDAKGLAIEQNILADLVVGDLLAKAEREMMSLKETANIQEDNKQ